MNPRLPIATLLLAISSLAVAADEEQVKVCELVQAESLAPWGYGARLHRENWSLTFDKAQINAPSDVHSDTCTLRSENAQHQGATVVVVESFDNNTGVEAISSWLKGSSARPREADEKFKEIRVDDVTCEAGEYSIPASGGTHAIQYYVACDRLVGRRHLMVNIQHLDAAKLPTPPQVKELLDQVATNLGKV